MDDKGRQRIGCEPIGVGRAEIRSPSLQTGQAVFPHPAFQSVGSPARGSGSSPRPQVRRSDVRYHPSQWHSADSPTGEPSRALALVFFSVFLSFALPPSCVPSLHGRYPLPRYYERSDSRQPGTRTVRPTHPPAPAGLPGFCSGASNHSISNHRCDDRSSSGCQRIYARPDRLRLSLEDSPVHTDRIEFTATAPTDSLCYGLVVLVPLLSTPHCCDAVTVRYRTILHRTEADFHRPSPAPSQAHECARPRAQPRPKSWTR
jgi:hypothetical protein